MNKILKINAIIIIQAMLLVDIAFCAQVSLVERNTLSPELQVNISSFAIGFKNYFEKRKDFESLVNGQKSSFMLDNASKLLTAQSITEVEDIIKQIIQSLGFSRVKFYEVTRHDEQTGKWWLKQEMKISDKDGGSDRYSREGLALDEKEAILNQAKQTGQDIFHEENRWAHIIGDNDALLQYVDPALIEWDADEFGDGNPERVKEFLHIISRNSNGEIVGILGADKWQKPTTDDITRAETIFSSVQDKENKVKILRIFARLGGIAIQRIRFKSTEKEMENFQVKEEALFDILHDLKNRLIDMTYTVIRMESKERKKRIRKKIINIENIFKSLAVWARQWTGKLEISAELQEEKLAEQILQIIEETATAIQGREVDKVRDLFAQWKEQLKAQVKEAKGKTTAQQEKLFYFLQDFEKLAIYQAGLFIRQESISTFHKEIQHDWSVIEEVIKAIEQERKLENNQEKIKVIDNILESHKKAKEKYDKYIELFKDLTSGALIGNTIIIEAVVVKDIISQVINNLPADIEANISIKPFLPNINIDRKLFMSMLDEMIENARKYGGKYFALNVRLDKDDIGFVRMEITTKGRGIPEDKWSKVFIREFRVDEDDGLGTGFGLDIAKRDIERMGGKIWISKSSFQDEEHEGGTTFSIQVPLADVSFLGEEVASGTLTAHKSLDKNSLIDTSI